MSNYVEQTYRLPNGKLNNENDNNKQNKEKKNGKDEMQIEEKEKK